MFKWTLSLAAVVFTSILLSSGVSLANNTYHNDKLDASFNLGPNWYKFSEDMYSEISPSNKERLVESFVNKSNKDLRMDLYEYTQTSQRYNRVRDILNYAKETPLEERDYSRMTNFIPIEFGSKMKSMTVDSDRDKITVNLSGTNKSGKYDKLVGWYFVNDVLIEFDMTIKQGGGVNHWSDKFNTIVNSVISPSIVAVSDVTPFDGDYTSEDSSEEISVNENEPGNGVKKQVTVKLKEFLDKVLDMNAMIIVSIVIGLAVLVVFFVVRSEYKKNY